MTSTEIQSAQQSELHNKLWTMVNKLRGNMEAYEFKNYILGLIFYRYLSSKFEEEVASVVKGGDYKEAWNNEEKREYLIEMIKEDLGYIIRPEHLFSSLIDSIKNHEFDIASLQQAISTLEDSTRGHESEEAFSGLFDDMDLGSSKLGRDPKSRSALMADILETIDTIEIDRDNMSIDVLGDAYEFLIGMFAQTAGKKAGEFWTPVNMATLVARIAAMGRTQIKSACDPACGAGGLLLKLRSLVGPKNLGQIYGQEKTSTTYNLARMNMLLHDVEHKGFHIKNCDTLEDPCFGNNMEWEVQVANPPYSVQWSANPRHLEDERFAEYGKLAPKSKGDFAFVQHMIHHMEDNGVAVVLLPHGVLFREGAEGHIRRHIIQRQNCLDAVIGLPANCFMGTGIPVVCLVFKKNRRDKDNIFFMDASSYYEPGKNQNRLRDEDIERILKAYEKREEVEKLCRPVSIDEIESVNGFNCNISRYVNTTEQDELIDIEECNKELISYIKKIQEIDLLLSNMIQGTRITRGAN